MADGVVGVIGGSGLYEIDGLEAVEELTLETPYGPPSDSIVRGRLGDVVMLFLPRHGRGHRLTPTAIPYRANVWAMKKLGAEWVISVSAVGSLQEDIRPGDIVVVDQFIDRTRLRPSTFFEDGVVAQVQFADPVCLSLARRLFESADEMGVRVHERGTYCCMEGPAFSTRAESHMYRQLGAHLIGMTNLPEAKLAREAEICYATLALVTDYDCWRTDEDDVRVEDILGVLKANVSKAKQIIAGAVASLPDRSSCGCPRALANALLTSKSAMPEAVLGRLGPIVERVLGSRGR